MFNTIFETANMPRYWKEAGIIDLYKEKGDRKKMEVRTGIKLASNIFEIVINNRLVKDLKFTKSPSWRKKE